MQCIKNTHIILIRKLRRLPCNLSSLKLLSTPISILDRRAPLQILELDGSLGSTTGLLHNRKSHNFVRFAVEFDSESILDIRCVYCHREGGCSLEGCGLGCKCGGGGEEGCDEEVAEGRHDEDDTTTERNATMQNYELARLRAVRWRWRWPSFYLENQTIGSRID